MAPKLRTDDEAEYDCPVYQQQHERVGMNKEISKESKNSNLLQKFERIRKEHGPIQSRNKCMALIFGQSIALVATSMNASSYVLEYGMHRVFPMFLLFNSYMILTLHLLVGLSSSRIKNKEHSPLAISTYTKESETGAPRYRLPLTSLKLRTPWYYYLCLSCLDIGPNYLTLLAMNKTSFTSATLLGSLTVPSTMIFCRLLLGKEYRRMHYVGVILCMIGGSITVFTDKVAISSSGDENSHPHSYGGDILAVLASLGYGVGDACAEFWSKHVDREEYLGMIGLFGAISTLMASFVYERNAVLEVFTSDNETMLQTLGAIVCYVVSLVTYYVFESLFLMKSDATLLNLSLQSSNFWAILFSMIVFKEGPNLHFYVSIFMGISGVFVYELHGNNTTTRFEKENDCITTESSFLLNDRDRHDQSSRYTIITS